MSVFAPDRYYTKIDGKWTKKIFRELSEEHKDAVRREAKNGLLFPLKIVGTIILAILTISILS